jgi:integrase
LRTALQAAAKDGIVPRNAAADAKPPKVARYRARVLTKEEAAAFTAACAADQQLALLEDAVPGHHYGALYLVAVSLGLRQGEILGLRWGDVDLDAPGALSITHGLQRVDGKLKLVPPKTERSERSLRLPGFALEALRTHRQAQRQDRLKMGSAWRDTGHVFTTGIGSALDGGRVTKRFRAWSAANALPSMRFHDLRRSCATLLHNEGVPDRVIMEILGHSQISVTMNTYTDVLTESKDRAADAMDRALGGGSL